MMGRSLELLGMASFNVFLGLVLTVTFLNQNGNEKPSRLTEARITEFVTEMTHIALGNNPQLDQLGITTWLMDHLEENSSFSNNMNVLQANGQTREEKLEMNRMDYISHVLGEIKTVKSREANLHIEYIKIEESGKGASVIFTSMEKGRIPVVNEDTSYEIPVSGTSYCEQKIILDKKIIKVSNATCTTNVSMTESY